MIALERIATLDVSAASGLAIVGDRLVVIADDELSLSRYDRGGRPCGRVRLFAGELPAEPGPRKLAKPDLEALAALPDQRLLALGSGSTKHRDRAAAIDGDAVVEVDLGPLYDALRDRLDRLNVEGAAVGRAGRSCSDSWCGSPRRSRREPRSTCPRGAPDRRYGRPAGRPRRC